MSDFGLGQFPRHLLASVFLFGLIADGGDTPPSGDKDGWQSLFDGRSLKGWKVSEFALDDEVRVEGGKIILEFGSANMSGITRTASVPDMDYELELEAMRVDGFDFFCGLTFPVGKTHCSLIVGGWGGRVVGLSSLDRMDASENETKRLMDFETGRWYRIKVRVTGGRIEAWIDGKQVVNAITRGRRVHVRNEMDLSKPMGVSTWQTKAAIRNIRVRRLSP